VLKYLSIILLFFYPLVAYPASVFDEKCEDKIRALINVSMSKLGCSYVWAATGPYSFDCSGFTQYVFAKLDINIPRTASEQFYYQEGKRVSVSFIKKGDLVFFISRDFNRFIGHVGIAVSDYDDGDFRFIHASSAQNAVSINYFSERNYMRTYAGARRIILCSLVNNDIEYKEVLVTDEDEFMINTQIEFNDESIDFNLETFPEEYFYHHIKREDNLKSLSRMYRVSERDILRWNNLKSNASLRSVKRIRIYPSLF
jgi:hypothetical protein